MIMSNETERTLHELKLPGMASCWSSLEETHQLDKLTLREGMQIMQVLGQNMAWLLKVLAAGKPFVEEKGPAKKVFTNFIR